ncbi:MAG: hypothetical protein ACI9KE_000249 [Polyangiales bacterium]|jgi:hypothetical protein
MLKMMVGRIPQENGHHISTTFLSFMGPLIPVKSMYVTHEEYSRSAGTTTHSSFGQDLPVQWDSTLLGYLRVWLCWAACASPFVMFWEETLDLNRPEWAITIGLAVAWVTSLALPQFIFRMGREKRLVLAQGTGISVEPRRFGKIQRSSRCDTLADQVDQLGMDSTNPAVFAQQATSANASDFPLLYSYARYAAAMDSKWEAAADAVWKWRGSQS